MKGKSDRIYFRCPGCRGELEIERGAAGHITPCPTCGRNVAVPRESVMSPAARKRAVMAASAAAAALPVILLIASLTGGGKKQDAVAAPVRLAAPEAPRPARPLLPIDDLVTLEAANRKLADETVVLRQQVNGLLAWIMDNFRGKFPLAEKFMAKLRVAPVTEDYRLNTELAELLNLQPREQSLVNDAFVASAMSMTDIESSIMTVNQSDQNRVTIHIPAYPEEGAVLREDLYSALEMSVGGARFNRLLDVSENDMLLSYHYFGAATRTMVMEVAYPTNGYGPTELIIRDGWIIPSGEDSREYRLTESRVTKFPREYLAYWSALPESISGAVAR